jgi:muconolactone delta-isomerase
MRFLVETAFRQMPTPEILALIPAETEHGSMLDAEGIREQLFIAADVSRAWQVFRAGSAAEVEAIAKSFPLAPYVTATITPLADAPGV